MQKKVKLIHICPVIIGLCLTLVTTGCSFVKFPAVYRIPILQGNIIDGKKVNQLEKGMTKRQVSFIMGGALINDVFNDDRWDYVYRLHRGDKTLRNRRFTLFFENDKLARWEGDFEPEVKSEEDAVDDDYIIQDAKKTEG